MRISSFFASAVFLSVVSLAAQAQPAGKVFPPSEPRTALPATGTINVYTSPFGAEFWLLGPANYTGDTNYMAYAYVGPTWWWWKSDCPAGTYRIIYANVPGYITPVGQTLTLVADGTINFTGSYVPGGARSVSPAALSFTYTVGQALPSPQIIAVTTPGASAQIAASVYGNLPWLAVTPASYRTPATLVVTLNPTGLSDGTYQALIMISFEPAYQPVTVPVTLVVLTNPELVVTPASLSFAYQIGANPPDGQRLSISSMYKNVNFSINSNVSWLTATGTGTTPLMFAIWVDPAGLLAGTYHGIITVSSAAAANSPQIVQVTLVVTGTPTPPANMAVLNAASQDRLAAPCSIVSIYGTNLAQREEASLALPLPFTLGGASVKVNGRAVPLFYASPGQLNVQVHCNLATGVVQVEVNNGAASGFAAVQIANAAPGLFLWQDRWVAAQNEDGSIHGEYNPAAPGSVVTVYFTGQGLLDHPIKMGDPAPMNQLLRPLIKPIVTINGQKAELLFAGLTPGAVGLAQLNIRVPDLPAGEYPVVVTMGGVSSNVAILCIGSEYQNKIEAK